MSASGLVVVCGATGALGQPLVAAFVERGHTVLAVARGRGALDDLAGRHAGVETLAGDALDEDLPTAVRAAVAGRHVAAIVHAAAVPLTGDILETDLRDITRAVDVKVGGLVRLVRGTRECLGEGARVIAIGGSFGYDPSPAASTAGIANAALANLVRQLARTLGPVGATAHVVAPGPVVTPRLRSLVEREAAAAGTSPDEVLATRAAGTARGRLTTPEEVASAVVRLLEPWAAATTGSTWFLDGGARTATP